MSRVEAIDYLVTAARNDANEWCVGPSEYAAAEAEMRDALAALGVTAAEVDAVAR